MWGYIELGWREQHLLEESEHLPAPVPQLKLVVVLGSLLTLKALGFLVETQGAPDYCLHLQASVLLFDAMWMEKTPKIVVSTQLRWSPDYKG